MDEERLKSIRSAVGLLTGVLTEVSGVSGTTGSENVPPSAITTSTPVTHTSGTPAATRSPLTPVQIQQSFVSPFNPPTRGASTAFSTPRAYGTMFRSEYSGMSGQRPGMYALVISSIMVMKSHFLKIKAKSQRSPVCLTRHFQVAHETSTGPWVGFFWIM